MVDAHAVGLVDEEDAAFRAAHRGDDVVAGAPHVAVDEVRGRHHLHLRAGQQLQVLEGHAETLGRRGLARAGRPGEDHVQAVDDGRRVAALRLGLEHRVLELVDHLHDVVRRFQIRKRAFGLLRARLLAREVLDDQVVRPQHARRGFARAEFHLGAVQQRAAFPRVAEVVQTPPHGDELDRVVQGGRVDGQPRVDDQVLQYLAQLLVGEVLELQALLEVEPPLQAGVLAVPEQVLHLRLVAREHDGHVGPRAALDALHQRIDDVPAEVVRAAGRVQPVRLVDEEHLALGLREDARRGGRCLPHGLPFQVAGIDFDEIPVREEPALFEQLAVQARHGGFARARVAEEDTVQ